MVWTCSTSISPTAYHAGLPGIKRWRYLVWHELDSALFNSFILWQKSEHEHPDCQRMDHMAYITEAATQLINGFSSRKRKGMTKLKWPTWYPSMKPIFTRWPQRLKTRGGGIKILLELRSRCTPPSPGLSELGHRDCCVHHVRRCWCSHRHYHCQMYSLLVGDDSIEIRSDGRVEKQRDGENTKWIWTPH